MAIHDTMRGEPRFKNSGVNERIGLWLRSLWAYKYRASEVYSCTIIDACKMLPPCS